jgi:metal-responsive CopG/Arc/MetJ family transcriptional regulator
MPSPTKQRVAVKVDLPKQLDREMEVAVALLDISKRQFIEEAVREKLATKRSRVRIHPTPK